MTTVSIIGGSGYGGGELLPEAEVHHREVVHQDVVGLEALRQQLPDHPRETGMRADGRRPDHPQPQLAGASQQPGQHPVAVCFLTI